MMNVFKFIGRQNEIARFEAEIDGFPENNHHIVFIYDEVDPEMGGIGKTKLLQKFVEILKSAQYKDRFLILDEIFDFYEPVNRDRLSRLSLIAQKIETKTQTKSFDRFWKSCREYYARMVSVEKVVNDFFEAYNLVSREERKKIVCLFDTFELGEKTLNYLQAPFRFFDGSTLDSSFIIISGRHKPDFSAPIWEGRKSQLIEFPLKGFSIEETKEYFLSSGVGDIDDHQIADLNIKARGRPILLALIIDYLRNILLPDDILKLEKDDFEEQLVAFIKAFNNPPIDQAILAMAHLKHWCNAKFLRKFVRPNEQFDEDYKVLKSLSFVRTLGTSEEYVVLHDQMQEMVSQYVLDKDYSDGTLRREISSWAIDFYGKEIEILKKQENQIDESIDGASKQVVRNERFALKAELWYHRLYVSNGNELDYYFYDLFDSSLEEGYLDYCFILQAHLRDLSKLLNLPARTRNRIVLRAARLNTEKYQFTNNQYYFDEAQKSFETLILDARKSEEKGFLGVLLCDFGILKFYLRNLVDAESVLRQSVEVLGAVSDQDNHDIQYFLGKSKNWLGYILYNQGKFTESIKILEQAEQNLFAANNLVVEEQRLPGGLLDLRKKQIDGWIAQVRGNLCRIYREIGDSKKAIYYGESSLTRREKLRNPREIVRGLNTLGLVYSRIGDTEKALRYYRRANDYLQNVVDPILGGRVSTNIATLLFKRDQYSDLLSKRTKVSLVDAKKNLEIDYSKNGEARRLLNKVIDSLFRTNSRELATAYHNLGELNLLEEKYTDARLSFDKSAEVAQIDNDAYTLLNSLQRLVLTAYLEDDSILFESAVKRFQNALGILLSFEETARYVIRFHITVGNFSYDKLNNKLEEENFERNFRDAFNSYTNAIVYARDYARGSVDFAKEVFAERIFELMKICEISQHLRHVLLGFWQEHNLDLAELHQHLNF